MGGVVAARWRGGPVAGCWRGGPAAGRTGGGVGPVEDPFVGPARVRGPAGAVPGQQIPMRLSIAARAVSSSSYTSHMWRPSGVAVCSTSHRLVSLPSSSRNACS
ncbi:hypothetical protein GA0115244_112546 [Streptomyces sp. DvalAA-19]|nr:hypothetical protein GA0115244_112546 [Streptomyces sp. DvalAA-19]